jgi:hypothetical protein
MGERKEVMAKGVGSEWWLDKNNLKVVARPRQETSSMIETLERALTTLHSKKALRIPKKYAPSLAQFYARLRRKGLRLRTATNGTEATYVWTERITDK